MSTSTGAPAAFARSLGHSDITNGVATATAPIPPTTEVAPIRKRRLSLSTIASVTIPAFRCVCHDSSSQNLRIIREPVCRFEVANRNYAIFPCGNSQFRTGPEIVRLPWRRSKMARKRADYNRRDYPVAPVLRKFWLLFTQACTLALAALFVVATLRPDLLPPLSGKANNVVLLQQASPPVATPTVASYADAARKAMPAVVNIYTSKAVRARNPLLDDSILQRYFPALAERAPSRRATSLGSGVIVAPEGYVLTNHHVIDGADDIELVLADGRELHATVRGVDPESDLAVLKVDGELLPAITFGSMEKLH